MNSVQGYSISISEKNELAKVSNGFQVDFTNVNYQANLELIFNCDIKIGFFGSISVAGVSKKSPARLCVTDINTSFTYNEGFRQELTAVSDDIQYPLTINELVEFEKSRAHKNLYNDVIRRLNRETEERDILNLYSDVLSNQINSTYGSSYQIDISPATFVAFFNYLNTSKKSTVIEKNITYDITNDDDIIKILSICHKKKNPKITDGESAASAKKMMEVIRKVARVNKGTFVNKEEAKNFIIKCIQEVENEYADKKAIEDAMEKKK